MGTTNGDGTDSDRDEVCARPTKSDQFPHGDITRQCIGALYAVHSELGYGFLEGVYRNALIVALRQAGLKLQREVPFDVQYRGHVVGYYRADLIVEGAVVLEVKAAQVIQGSHQAQLRNHLRASGIEVGLLLNFGVAAQFKRLALSASSASRCRD